MALRRLIFALHKHTNIANVVKTSNNKGGEKKTTDCTKYWTTDKMKFKYILSVCCHGRLFVSPDSLFKMKVKVKVKNKTEK